MLLRTMRKEEERRVVEHTPSGTCSSLDNVEKGLYEKISERYSSAHAAFRAFAEGSVLGIDNVKSMVDRVVCVRIDREILATLVRRMGDGGPIRYHAFRKYINMLENKFNGGQPKPIEPTERALPPRQQYHNPEQNLSRTVHNVNKIQDMILEKMKQRYRSPSQAFLKFDHQRCGFISIQEFRMVLEQSGIHLSDENFRTISRRFDRDGNNRISYHEFVRQMSTPPASHEKRKHAEDQARNMQLAQAREKSLEYRNELKRMIENKKQRQREEKERIRRLEEKEEREAANYNPWGRGGCGAPLRDSAGNVLANFQTRGKASTEPMSRPAPARVYQQQQQQQQQQQYNQQRQRRNNNNNDEATSSKHARFRFEDLPSYEREAIQTKNQKQLQWQRDLALQVERKKRMKEQEAARKREEEIKERARLERQRIELQRENEERIRLEKLKKESEDNTPQSSRQVSMPRQVVSTPRQDPPPTITTTTSTTERKRITTESTPQLHRHHEEETFESSSPSKITNDAMFLKELEMRHEDALERQQRAFDVSMSPSRQQSYSSSPIRDHHQQQQIESTSSIVYMANSSSSGGDGDHHRQTLLSPSFTNSNKSKSEILMDFLKRRNMWS